MVDFVLYTKKENTSFQICLCNKNNSDKWHNQFALYAKYLSFNKWFYANGQSSISYNAINELECCFISELAWTDYPSIRKSFMITQSRELIIPESKE